MNRSPVLVAGSLYLALCAGQAQAFGRFAKKTPTPIPTVSVEPDPVSPPPIDSPAPPDLNVLPETALPAVELAGTITYTRPTKLENMVEILPGTFQAVDFTHKKVACLHFNIGPIAYGSTVTKSFTRTTTLKITKDMNHKSDRNWNRHQYPNHYEGSQSSGQYIIYTEKLTPQGKGANYWTRAYYSPPTQGTGKPEQWIRTYRYPTGQGKADGRYTIQLNGKTIFDKQAWTCDSTANPGLPDDFIIQDVITGSKPLPGLVNVTYSDVSLRVSR